MPTLDLFSRMRVAGTETMAELRFVQKLQRRISSIWENFVPYDPSICMVVSKHEVLRRTAEKLHILWTVPLGFIEAEVNEAEVRATAYINWYHNGRMNIYLDDVFLRYEPWVRRTGTATPPSGVVRPEGPAEGAGIPEDVMQELAATLKDRMSRVSWIPREIDSSEALRRTMAAAMKLMLGNPDVVRRAVVDEAHSLRRYLEELKRLTGEGKTVRVDDLMVIVRRATVLSSLLLLLAALEELRGGGSGDVAFALSDEVRLGVSEAWKEVEGMAFAYEMFLTALGVQRVHRSERSEEPSTVPNADLVVSVINDHLSEVLDEVMGTYGDGSTT